MGVLRYFPGSEPTDGAAADVVAPAPLTPDPITPAPVAPETGVPLDNAPETHAPPADWAVPVLGVEPKRAPSNRPWRDAPNGGEADAEKVRPERNPVSADKISAERISAEKISMGALARHDASEGELTATLRSRGLDDDAVFAEIERLKSVGLIDDRAFADRLVVQLRERKRLGDSGVRSALRQRKLSTEVIEAALAVEEDEDVAADRLEQVAAARARQLMNLPRDVAERRLSAFLMRRGYSGGDVRQVVRDAIAGDLG